MSIPTATPTIAVAPLPVDELDDSRKAKRERRRAAERGARSLASPMALRSRKGKTIYWTVFTAVLDRKSVV